MKITTVEQPPLSSANVSAEDHSATLYLSHCIYLKFNLPQATPHGFGLSPKTLQDKLGVSTRVRTHPRPECRTRRGSTVAAGRGRMADVGTHTWGNTHKHAGSDEI